MLRSCFVGSLTLLHLPAQEPLPARAFLMDDYRNVGFVDLKALRERGIWADLEVSLLKVVFKQMEKGTGFPLAALDRVTTVADFGADGEDERTMARNVREVLVFEGNRALGVPDSVAKGSYVEATVGKYTVHRRDDYRAETFVQTRPEMQVHGATDVVEAALAGKPHTGRPCSDVMSLLSGRGENLAYFAFDTSHSLMKKSAFGELFPDAQWPDADGPSFLFGRLRATGDVDDPHLEVEMVLRHPQEGAGLAESERVVVAWIERIKKDPKMRTLWPLFARIERRRDHGDLCLRANLGRTREAVGHLAAIALPLLAPRVLEARDTAVLVAPAPAPAPATDPKK